MKVKTNNKKYKILLFFKNVSLKNTAQKMKFSIKDFFSKYAFTEEIFNEKLHFLCRENVVSYT